MSDPEVGEAPGRDMSDPDVSEAPEPASEDKEQRRRRKKERKRRTPEEKEERRRRKEAAANAAANVDANVRADDSAAEVDADADGAISGTTPAGSPSVKFSASSRKSPDVDVEKGAVVDEKLRLPTTVPPSFRPQSRRRCSTPGRPTSCAAVPASPSTSKTNAWKTWTATRS